MTQLDQETAQLLARLKLQVRRQLDRSVDLQAITENPEYARQTLALIEEAAENEDLLVLVLRLRERLPGLRLAPEPYSANRHAPRDYRFGARNG